MDVIMGGASRRTPRLIPVLAVLLLVLALAAGALYIGGRPNPQPVVVPSASPTATVATTPTILPSEAPTPSPLADATTTLPYRVIEIIVGDDAMWASVSGETSNELAHAIYRIDPTTSEATLVVPELSSVVASPIPFVQTEGSVWAAVDTNNILRFDSVTGEALGSTPVGTFPIEPLAGLGAVWSENYDDGTLTRIDPATGAVVATIVIPQFAGQGPRDIAAGASLLWAITPRQNTMVAIDPATNTVVREVPLDDVLHCGVTVAAQRVWVEGCDAGDPTQVFDEATGALQGSYPGGMPVADDGRFVWVPGGTDSTTLGKFDPVVLSSGLPIVDLGVRASYVTSGFGSIWYSDGPNLHRLGLESLIAN